MNQPCLQAHCRNPLILAHSLAASPFLPGLQHLQRAHAANDVKLDELRVKLRVARTSLSDRDRQLAAAKRAISKLAHDKMELQVGGLGRGVPSQGTV